jgi:hypothetical protein
MVRCPSWSSLSPLIVVDPANFAPPSQPDWAIPGYGAAQSQMQNIGGRGMAWNAGPAASSPIAQHHQPFSNVGYTGYEAFTAAANNAYAAGGGRPANLTVRTAVPQPTTPHGQRFMGGSPLTLTHSPVSQQMSSPYLGFSRGPPSASLDTMQSYGDVFQRSHHPQASHSGNRQSGGTRWPSSAGLPVRTSDELGYPEHPSFMSNNDPFMPTVSRQTSGGFYSQAANISSPASAPLIDPAPLPWRRNAPQSGSSGGSGSRELPQMRTEDPQDVFPPLSGLGQSRRTG